MATTGRIQRTEEERKRRPINKLQTGYAIRALQDERYKATLDAKKEGLPIAWCMSEPYSRYLFNAIGIRSVAPENYASVCAAATGDVATSYLERADAEGFPNHLCGYLRTCIGYTARMMVDLGGEIPPEAPQGGMPKPDLLVNNVEACETHFKAFQAMGRYFGAPVWTVETPRGGIEAREQLMGGAYEHTIQWLVKEVREFAALLERLLGKKVDWDVVDEDIDRTMEFRDLFYEITDELRKARPCPMNARDHYASMGASMWGTSDPVGVKKLFGDMYDEVKHRVDNKISGINHEEKYRMLWNGLGPWHSMGIYDQLAEKGWNFVREGYHPPHPIDLSGVKDPVEKIVRYSQRGLARRIDDEFEPEEAAGVKAEIKEKGYSTQLAVVDIKNYQVDGVVLHTLLTCRRSTSTLMLYQNQLMDAYKVPCLVLEGDIIDKRLFDPEEFMKKAEAFEETMAHYKEVRKKEGLPW